MTEKDSGYYICYAENSQGSSRDYVYLQIEKESTDEEQEQQLGNNNKTKTEKNLDKRPFVFLKALNDGEQILAGQFLKLMCLVNDPNAQVEFYPLSKSSNNNELIVDDDDDRIRMDNDDNVQYEIEFNPFDERDAQDSFRCIASNQYGIDQDTAFIDLEADGSYTFRTGF